MCIRDSGGEWNFETMNLFLIKPKKYISGTKMSYAGLKSEKDRKLMRQLIKNADVFVQNLGPGVIKK